MPIFSRCRLHGLSFLIAPLYNRAGFCASGPTDTAKINKLFGALSVHIAALRFCFRLKPEPMATDRCIL